MWLTTPGAGPVCPPHGWKQVILQSPRHWVLRYGTAIRASIFASSHPLNLSMAPKECYDGADVVLRNQKFADLYGSFSVKWFFVCCRFLVWSGKAVPRPVACDQVRGARGRCQGTEMLAQLSGLPLSVACVQERLDT